MPQKAHLNGSKRGPKKGFFLIPKMSVSRFSNFDLCRGTRGSQHLDVNHQYESLVLPSGFLVDLGR